MVASSKIRDRIKKLLGLSTSPEKEEAARAREQAEQLMVKYGLTESDFEEDVTEAADEQRDELRQRLALAVGISRRCAAVCSKKQIGFRGRAADAAMARRLYQSLVTEVVASCEIGQHDPGRDVWRIWFWTGFVDGVVGRLVDDETQAWRPPEKAAPKPSEVEMATPQAVIDQVPPVKEELDRATSDFAQHFDPSHARRGVEHLSREAYAYGKGLGERVHIEPREKPIKRAALGARENEGGA